MSLKFCNLYSGSSGNCSYIESDNSKIIIDCGTSAKKISEALASFGQNIEDLDAILITHEHSDHIRALSTICKNYNIPIYANKETFKNIKIDFKNAKQISFKNDETFEINDLKILPFSIPHDAANPCAFNIFCGNKKISIATDIGHVDNKILDKLNSSDFALIESNYEPEMLKFSRYPYNLKMRILGPNGHLSNNDAGNVISTLYKYGLNNIMLGHLSKENNFPELAYRTVMDTIISHNNLSGDLKLSVADRDKPNKMIEI